MLLFMQNCRQQRLQEETDMKLEGSKMTEWHEILVSGGISSARSRSCGVIPSPRYEEIFEPMAGPANPGLTEQIREQKNMLQVGHPQWRFRPGVRTTFGRGKLDHLRRLKSGDAKSTSVSRPVRAAECLRQQYCRALILEFLLFLADTNSFAGASNGGPLLNLDHREDSINSNGLPAPVPMLAELFKDGQLQSEHSRARPHRRDSSAQSTTTILKLNMATKKMLKSIRDLVYKRDSFKHRHCCITEKIER
ncbi:conserved hypothetical protein [Culex quinquefasciatus]|uniref:Uncharacterized protein n=1 Tax=Culex quinquefasciatus TaxID=7176 RepID=B0X550_CULQU|nr:conserved hypothetical protein [Culex quinquefasciatus]|eukprot:XP_001864772.1 conserved hypothetical protein [Culex quinquefasciatus]